VKFNYYFISGFALGFEHLVNTTDHEEAFILFLGIVALMLEKTNDNTDAIH